MILLGLGSNLGYGDLGPPEILRAATAKIGEFAPILARSSLYRSQAWPAPSDPVFCNAVIAVETRFAAGGLLAALQDVERAFGRRPAARNAPRSLDIDILDFNGAVSAPGETPELPHPRLAARLFVLAPLAEIAPDWRRPASGETVAALIAAAPPDPMLAKLPAQWEEGVDWRARPRP